MAKKNKQQIKLEAEIEGFKKAIKEGEQSVHSLTKELKLNQEQLKGNKEDTDLLSARVQTLQKEYEEQTKVVEETNNSYKKAVEILGENSEEARKWKDRLVEAETKQQKIKNSLNDTNEELKKQSNKLIENGKEWEESGKTIERIGGKIDSLGNKLSVISAGTTGVATVALKSAIDYESAFKGVEKTVDGTEGQLKELKQGILDMSTEIPTAATEIAGVAEAAGQLGIKTDDILSFTRVMVDLGESTNLSAGEAASSLAKFANITKMSSKNYDRLGSVVVALGNNFATTESDIVEMSTRLAATGELAGLSEPQILSIATAMSSVGIEAEAGGSAMSKLLKKIQTATETGNKDLKKFAEVAGMSIEEFKQAYEEDAVNALTAFIGGLNDTERNGKSAIGILDDMGLTEVRLSNTILSLANASDVMTDAVDLGNKAWEDNTALTDEAKKRYETTESQMLMLKNEANKLAVEFGNELAPSFRTILEDIKPFLGKISDVVKKFSELDDKTKDNIITAGAWIAAIGPATKVVGGITSVVGGGVSAVGTLTQAIGNLKNGTNEGSDSVKTLTSFLGAMTSPIGIATTALAVAAGTALYLSQQETEAQKAARELSEEVEKSRQELDNYNKGIDDSMYAELARMESIEKLKDELFNLADENGKVDEANRNRADFILNELNEALGTEYRMNGNTIESHKELQEAIQGTIDKEKARIILNAKKDKYANALENEEKYVEEAQKVYEQLRGYGVDPDNVDSVIQQWEKDVAEYNKRIQEGYKKGYTNHDKEMIELRNSRVGLMEKYSKKDIEALKNLDKAYDNSMHNVEIATKTKREYEEAYADFAEGNYEKINKIVTIQTEDWCKKSLKEMEEAIKIQTGYLKDYKKIHEETGNEIALANSEQAKENLETLKQEMANRLITVEKMGVKELTAWKYLMDNDYELFKTTFDKMSPEMQKNLNELIETIKTEEPNIAGTINELSSDIIENLRNNEEYRNTAIVNLQGFLKGVSDPQLRGLLEQAGLEDVESVMQGIKNGNLSETEGMNIIEGLQRGLQNETLNNNLYTEATNVVNTVSDSLKNDEEYRNAAITNLKGFLKGMNDTQLKETLKQSGINDVEQVIQGIRSGNLAESEGIKILNSLDKGLSNSSWQKKIFDRAKTLSSTVSGFLGSKVNFLSGAISGHADGLAYVPTNNYVARLHEGERVLTKKQNQDYTRNINNTSKSVTVNIYPQTMSEQEMVRVSNFIEKEWGMKT